MKINPIYKLLVSSYGFSLFSEGVLLPIYAIFVQNIGGDILDASGAMATFLIAQGIFTIIIHRLNRTKKHTTKLMILGWLIWVCGIAGYLLVSSTWMLFVTQIVTALGNSIADPIFDKELADHTDKENNLFERGLWEGLQDIIGGIAAILGGVLVLYFGFKVLILFMIGTATASLFTILIYVKKYKKKDAII